MNYAASRNDVCMNTIAYLKVGAWMCVGVGVGVVRMCEYKGVFVNVTFLHECVCVCVYICH